MLIKKTVIPAVILTSNKLNNIIQDITSAIINRTHSLANFLYLSEFSKKLIRFITA